jgi:hypothetical protein
MNHITKIRVTHGFYDHIDIIDFIDQFDYFDYLPLTPHRPIGNYYHISTINYNHFVA